MLKWSIKFVINRLIVLAVILVVLSFYLRTSCGRISFMGQLEQNLSSLKDIGRALENLR
jgi:hypothetical protein